MIKCILIDKVNINEIKIKNFSEEELYKKCNFKNNNNFNKIKIWSFDNNNIELWGKTHGLNNNKNNNVLLIKQNIDVYGKCIFILKNNENNIISFNIDSFNTFFNIPLTNTESEEILEEKNTESEEILEEKNTESEEILEEKNIESEETNIKILYKYVNNELDYEVYSYNDEN